MDRYLQQKLNKPIFVFRGYLQGKHKMDFVPVSKTCRNLYLEATRTVKDLYFACYTEHVMSVVVGLHEPSKHFKMH